MAKSEQVAKTRVANFQKCNKTHGKSKENLATRAILAIQFYAITQSIFLATQKIFFVF